VLLRGGWTAGTAAVRGAPRATVPAVLASQPPALGGRRAATRAAADLGPGRARGDDVGLRGGREVLLAFPVGVNAMFSISFG
jgi:hypothetical protein